MVTKRLLKLGTEGLEFLKNNLSDYFDDLVSLIHEMVCTISIIRHMILIKIIGRRRDFLFW